MAVKNRFLLIFVISLISVVVINYFNIDLWISAHFYQQDNHVWPFKRAIWVNVLHASVTYMTVATLLFCFSVLALGVKYSAFKVYRHVAIYVLCVFIIAPGILVNLVFKEHFGRPRPLQVQAFSGAAQFMPLWQYNTVDEREYNSFPSGHSSVPFALISFWFVLRLRHKKLAKGMLTVALVSGASVGLTRIVTGGHFFSDVLWSGFFAYFVSEFLLFYLKSDQLLAQGDSTITLNEKKLLGFITLILSLFAYSALS